MKCVHTNCFINTAPIHTETSGWRTTTQQTCSCSHSRLVVSKINENTQRLGEHLHRGSRPDVHHVSLLPLTSVALGACGSRWHSTQRTRLAKNSCRSYLCQSIRVSDPLVVLPTSWAAVGAAHSFSVLCHREGSSPCLLLAVRGGGVHVVVHVVHPFPVGGHSVATGHAAWCGLRCSLTYIPCCTGPAATCRLLMYWWPVTLWPVTFWWHMTFGSGRNCPLLVLKMTNLLQLVLTTDSDLNHPSRSDQWIFIYIYIPLLCRDNNTNEAYWYVWF